jgi:S1-C subfamily serine protease
VPVDTVNRVVPQLIAEGRYVRPTLGISVDQDVNRAIAQQLDVEGVAVLRVEPGSGADQAGLQALEVRSDRSFVPADVVLSVDGRPTPSVSALLSILDDYRIGDVVTLRVWRNDTERAVEVVLSGQAARE